jgi:3-oxosteroid 1-dehydrogenase
MGIRRVPGDLRERVARKAVIFASGGFTHDVELRQNHLSAPVFGGCAALTNEGDFVRIQVWDQRSQEHSASDEYGRLIVPEGVDDSHLIRGATLPELAAAISERLARYAPVTGGLAVSDDFTANLEASIARFNELAANGVDVDFGRGERAVQQLFNGDVRDEPGRGNPTMWPLSDTGPYYAALVTGGTLDTKGGPKTSVDAQVLDDMDRPIPGLYGVGNCVASASRRAYWAGGATIGPMIAFAYRAAQTADREPVKQRAKQGVHA